MKRFLLLLGVLACLLAFSNVAHAQETEEVSDCDVDAIWAGNDTDTDWSNAENWLDAKLPTELSKVLLLEDDAVTVLSGNDRVQVSSTRIGSQSLLRITSGSKLTIFNREVQCFATNWCSGHGECVGVNECECEEGWTGAACNLRRTCPEGGNRTQCGFCPEDGIKCDCGDNLIGQPQEYVSRLLLLQTNQQLRAQIAATIAKLATLKTLNGVYNPYSEELKDDQPQWIREIQGFASGPVEEIAAFNTDVLEDLGEIEAIPDPCDSTPEQEQLEDL